MRSASLSKAGPYCDCIQRHKRGAQYPSGIGYKNSSMTEFIDIYNFNDLKEAILNSRVGETIQLIYIRDGVTHTSIETTLGTHPDD